MELQEYIESLVDNNKELNYQQSELLRIFLKSDFYFIPFTIDGNWDFQENILTTNKIHLTEVLSEGSWSFEVSQCSLEDDTYMIHIYMNDRSLKKRFLKQYTRQQRRWIKTYIELYIPYSTVLQIYEKDICKFSDWFKNHIEEKEVH